MDKRKFVSFHTTSNCVYMGKNTQTVQFFWLTVKLSAYFERMGQTDEKNLIKLSIATNQHSAAKSKHLRPNIGVVNSHLQ